MFIIYCNYNLHSFYIF